MGMTKAVVVRYKLRKHPNADTLSIADIEGSAWQVVVKTEDFEPEGTGIYIPVDSMVPETPDFEFLRDRGFRVKAIKLRGEYSYGLLLPNKEKLPVGSDVTDKFGIRKYEPPTPIEMTGEVVTGLDWVIKYEAVLFGEVYGRKVQNLQYGLTTQKVVFYDAFVDGRYLDWDELRGLIRKNRPSLRI